jgi:replicative DNA helicase
MSDARFSSVADLLAEWRDDLLSGKGPVRYSVGLDGIEVGPGLVTLIGGAPGGGKTALVMQLVCEALGRTPDLKAVVCNVEMSPAVLLDRQLARLSGTDLSLIRHRRLGAAHGADLQRGLEALERVADRLAFVRPPYDLANVAASADAFDASLIVLDYIQRIGAPGEHGDRRGSVDATMGYLRQFADAGTAVVVVAALARSKDARGRSSYDGASLSLASFRETSELEYGADDAFILAPEGEDDGRILKHLKSRHGEAGDIALHFDGAHQRFTTAAPSPKPSGKAVGDGKLQAALRAAWGRTSPAPDETREDW